MPELPVYTSSPEVIQDPASETVSHDLRRVPIAQTTGNKDRLLNVLIPHQAGDDSEVSRGVCTYVADFILNTPHTLHYVKLCSAALLNAA